MNRFFITIILFSLFGCINSPKNTEKYQSEKEKDGIQKEKVDFGRDSEIDKNEFVKDIPFYRELITKLKNINDTIYICSRYSLEKFETVESYDTLIRLKHNLCEVKIESNEFNQTQHRIDLTDTIWKSSGKVDYLKAKNFIDDKRAYGLDGNIPETELSEFTIKVNQNIVQLSSEYFNDLYNVNIRKTEVYTDPESRLVYIYLSGSDAAGGYSAKYIIDENGYIARILAEYCGFDFIDGIDYDCF